ncbi:hypothetical protein B5V03_32465 [Bradyrhizobium betae]|uniref:Uncharacterized protein n=2 Tax=Bradyrhizobium betae TaxID=244734 RepID=A0A4Q1ULG9_9BRAD|nr:hypothetical protein B5V03_32465 [Bradyrhizobium betae]
MEAETAATLLARLLPVVSGREVSILVVSHDDIACASWGQSEALLASCLDYLAERPEVDPRRVGDFAASDLRVAAADCDAGQWKCTKTLASIGWLTRSASATEQDASSRRRLQFLRRLECPILVVAGGRGIVSVLEAIQLHTDCTNARIDLELAIPPMVRRLGRQIDNFAIADDCIFGWLEHKLGAIDIQQG